MRSLVKDVRKQWMLWLMVLPGILYVLIFNYLPMAGIVMAFQQLDLRKGVLTSPFVGFDNFKFLFASTDAWIITRNTVLYNAAFIVTKMFYSVGLAVIIHELRNKRFAKISQTILIMPYFLSVVVVATIVFAFLSPASGFVNSFLQQMGKSQVIWYNERSFWPPFLVGLNLWMAGGYSAIVYVAVLSGIPKDYYEAALIDGATKWQQFKSITLPQLRFIIAINLINSVGHIFKTGLGLFYTVPRNSGVLFPVTQTLDTYIFRGMQSMSNLGMTTAAGLYQSVVGLIMVLIANKIISKIDSEAAMF